MKLFIFESNQTMLHNIFCWTLFRQLFKKYILKTIQDIIIWIIDHTV